MFFVSLKGSFSKLSPYKSSMNSLQFYNLIKHRIDSLDRMIVDLSTIMDFESLLKMMVVENGKKQTFELMVVLVNTDSTSIIILVLTLKWEMFANKLNDGFLLNYCLLIILSIIGIN